MANIDSGTGLHLDAIHASYCNDVIDSPAHPQLSRLQRYPSQTSSPARNLQVRRSSADSLSHHSQGVIILFKT